MSFLVGKHWIDKCCYKRSVTIVTTMSETEERWQEAGNDENCQQNDESGREGWGRHTDVALELIEILSWLLLTCFSLPVPHAETERLEGRCQPRCHCLPPWCRRWGRRWRPRGWPSRCLHLPCCPTPPRWCLSSACRKQALPSWSSSCRCRRPEARRPGHRTPRSWLELRGRGPCSCCLQH